MNLNLTADVTNQIAQEIMRCALQSTVLAVSDCQNTSRR